MYDTIIIGAGMSGLAAGIRLAHYEQKVCILERHTTIGGLNSFYRLEKRDFDVGLHAITNLAPRGAKRSPLTRVLKQLRLNWDDLGLIPQIGSTIAFPGVALRFSNDFALLEDEVRRQFPGQIDNFRRLVAGLAEYEDFSAPAMQHSARAVLAETLSDPLLVEMLLCPIFFYGGAQEHDMSFGMFSLMFRSIFLEGFGRTQGGVRQILKHLVRKYKESGGELRLRAGVQRLAVRDGAVSSVILDDGSELTARRVLSSAGWPETARLCDGPAVVPTPEPGRMTFIESLSVLNVMPRELGYDRTMVFFNDGPRFDYRVPAELADVRSGIVCVPNNFAYGPAQPGAAPPSEGMVRISAMANYAGWAALDEPEYRLAKRRWYDTMIASAVRFVPDFRRAVVAVDMFTPRTIRRFTGHDNGAIYGCPHKRFDGTTHLSNLFVCGNDQGLIGIVGTLLSGITMANRHCLIGG
jgi:phytoene dehydrogenase-like protein